MLLTTLVCCGLTVAASAQEHSIRSLSQSEDIGTFKDPSSRVRPKFRYWLPDASVNLTHLTDDILQLGQRGAGGIELLSYYNYGGADGPPPEEVDWNVYGYGTPAYQNVVRTALEASKKGGLIMDFAMGPQSGQGVPAKPDEIGLSWELVSYNTTFNSEYQGQLPGWGSGEFVSAVTFDIINSTTVAAFVRPISTKIQYTYAADSLTEVTKLVSNTGDISVTVAEDDTKVQKLLYATYARRSYARACIASSEYPESILQNGSFAVDHFSVAGAKLTTDFLETHVISDDVKELFSEVGQYIWEDSVEIPTPVYWTPNFLEIFQQQHGYNASKHLQLLTGFNGDLMVNDPKVAIVSDSPDQGAAFVSDYRSTMSFLYGTYLNSLKTWTSDYLGLQFSAQVSYNLPLDMLQNIPSVDVPETETLSFLNNIDAYRQFTGPADLAGRAIISIELGADYGQTFSQTLTGLLAEAKRAYAAGVNQVVLHGAPYSWNYPNTTWPGFTSFAYSFGGQHSRHQPAWDIGYPESLAWLARTQYVMQSGVPKVDLAFWDKQTAQDPFPATLYTATDLAVAGYSYQYLSPENFDLPEAKVVDATLAPTKQALRAFILRENDTLTIGGVDALATFASAGLPIIISGGIPATYASSNTTAISAAKEKLSAILQLKNVRQINDESIASVLQELDILPRTQLASNGTWYTRWREENNGDIYVFLFSDTVNTTTGTVAFETTGVPYFLNLWTGEEEAVIQYSVANGYTTIPLTLAPTQGIIVKFARDGSNTPSVHVTSASSSVLGYSYSSTSRIITAKVGQPSSNSTSTELTLSNGSTIHITPTNVSPFSLSNWTLEVEKWLPPNDLWDVDTVANKTNITIPLSDSILLPWATIPGLSNVSGIGQYTTTFNWPPASDKYLLGAYLSIPPVTQGLKAILNGFPLPALDLLDPVVDITSLLTNGANNLTLITSTPLFNSVRPIWDKLLTSGISPAISLETLNAIAGLGVEQLNGLIGEVIVIPYESTPIQL